MLNCGVQRTLDFCLCLLNWLLWRWWLGNIFFLFVIFTKILFKLLGCKFYCESTILEVIFKCQVKIFLLLGTSYSLSLRIKQYLKLRFWELLLPPHLEKHVGGVNYFCTLVYSLFIMMMMMVMVTAGVFCLYNYSLFGIVFTSDWKIV